MQPSPAADRLAAVSGGSALVVFGIGGLGLVGWMGDIPVLKSLHPGLVTMKANTALAFLLTGIALWLSSAPRAAGRARRPVAWGCAIIVAGLGLLTLLEYAFGWDLRIDQWLFSEPAGAVQTVHPGRRAPNTAFLFLLLGGALLWLDVQTRRGHRPAQYLIALAGIIAGAALGGYLYGASVLYSPSASATAISLPAALAGMAACMGLFCARPGPELLAILASPQAGSRLARQWFLPLLLLPLLLDVILLAGQRAELYNQSVAMAAHVVCLTAIFAGLGLAAMTALNQAEAELDHLRRPSLDLPAQAVPVPGARSPRKLRYLAAIVLAAAGAGVRLGFFQALGTHNVYVTFYPAVMLAALYGGLPAGLLATVISGALAAYYWIEPAGLAIQAPSDWLGLTIFLVGGSMISGITETLHRAQARARAAEAQAALAIARQREEKSLKKAHAELETTNARLQSEIVVRQQTEAQLRHTTQELERSNLDLEQFAYVASHDLQEPLRAVAGYVQLLEDRFGGQLDEKGLSYIAGADAGAKRMKTLILDLLELSRVGTQGKIFAPANLETVLDQALSGLQTGLRETGAQVIRDPLPTLAVDATQIMQLFQNLISNAIKFHADRPPEIHVGAQREPGRWRFSVRDNGIGIEPQYFERIFQVFQRLHTRREYPGTGIGLALCRRIVERHGGKIWVESQPGQGATFHFTLPHLPPA